MKTFLVGAVTAAGLALGGTAGQASAHWEVRTSYRLDPACGRYVAVEERRWVPDVVVVPPHHHHHHHAHYRPGVRVYYEPLPPVPPPAPPTAGLFADVVFDRPLDHAFTYAVRPELKDSIGVGKRVRAPFGRGDRTAVGYCVRVSETPPPRAVKELAEVLDDEALLDDHLMRLMQDTLDALASERRLPVLG